MFGRYAYRRLARRDGKGGENGASTATPVIHVTSSTSFTGAVAGYSTLSSSSSITTEATKTETTTTEVAKTEPTSAATTIDVLKSLTSSVLSSSKTLAMPTSTTQAEVQQTETPYKPNPQDDPNLQNNPSPQSNPTTQSEPAVQSTFSSQQTQATIPPMKTPAPPQPSLSEAHDTTNIVVEVPTTAIISSSSAQPAKLMVTSLEDLPQSIMSPTSSVPVSMSLLVASSSTSAAIMSTLVPKPSILMPAAASSSSITQSNAPGDTSMNASGKVSLILGIVLFLATGCIMYQLYFRKKRQAARLSQNEDNEKQSFAGVGAGIKNVSNNTPPTSQINLPPSKLSSNVDTPKTSTLEDPVNPFGNHAEIIVDSVNAQGPKVINKVDSPAPRLARGASKRGVMSHAHVPGNTTIADQGSTTAEYNTCQGPKNSSVSSAPKSASKTVPAVYGVQLDFNPSMDDELLLRSGQLVRVLHEFDDGWAMCIRLDGSEQGVCPRTCLSSRPLKPRSQSSSTIGRPCPQAPIGQNNSPDIKDAGTLPTSPQELPGHRVNVFNENQPVMGPNSPNMRPLPQVPVETQNSTSSPAQGLANDMIHDSVQTSNGVQNTDILPLKNAARFVAPAHDNCHNLSASQVSIAQSVDYFSFSKPCASDDETLNSIASEHGHRKSVESMCSLLGVTEPYLGQPTTSEKSVPGQAL